MPAEAVAEIAVTGLVVLVLIVLVWRLHAVEKMRSRVLEERVRIDRQRARVTELTHLFQIATRLNLQVALDDVIGLMVRRVTVALDAQQSSVMLLNTETNMLETRAFHGDEGERTANAAQPVGHGIAGWVATNRQSRLLNSASEHPELERYFKVHRRISSAVCSPILLEDKCIGVLNVNRINNPEPFNEDHQQILETFAEHVGAVIHRARALGDLDRRVKALEETNEKLTELNKIKDAFLSTASHELKTPLTSMIGYSELLCSHDDQLSDEQRKEFLTRLRTEARGLLGIIEGVMDLSRLEMGKSPLRLAPVSVNEVAASAVEAAQTLAKKNSVTIVERYADNLPQTGLDAGKVRQVFLNLLTNAVRFSPSGSEVEIITSFDDDKLTITVVDQGPGINPEEMDRIFTLFGQGVQKGARSTTGLGIGLNLVARIMEIHGGEVGVNSEPGQGSRFWVRFPLLAVDAPEEDAAEAA